MGIGLLANWAMTWGFDFGIYPFVIYTYGILWGGLVMTALSFLVCYATILFYDWAKKDWIGIETLKGIRESDSKNMIGKIGAWIMRKGDLAVMLFLSINFDPFITVAYMRQGANHFQGLSARDWKIFIASLVIGNAYWTLAVYMGITLVQLLWQYARTLLPF